MSSLYQLWRFENFLDRGATKDGYDALYVPVAGHTTCDIDIHDIHARPDGRPVFVATRFNCLATIAERASFAPVWRPPFIDRLAAGAFLFAYYPDSNWLARSSYLTACESDARPRLAHAAPASGAR